MGVNYKTLSDFEVATAEEAQSYFMDQAIIKVDAEADLTSLPNEVKTAYVLNTGVLMARDNTNAWKRAGGAAVVNETAPANPTVGDLWVKPSEVLPVPVRVSASTTATNITSTTAWATSIGPTAAITVPKATMLTVTYVIWLNAVAASTEPRVRIKWTGAGTGNSYDHMGGWAGTLATSVVGRTSLSLTFTVVVPAGTTTFQMEAYKSGTGTPTWELPGISLTPIAWADEFAAGVT